MEPIPEPWAEVIAAVVDADRFVNATFSGARRGTTPAAERIGVRPVELRRGRHLQVTVSNQGPDQRSIGGSSSASSSTVRNVPADQAADVVLGLLRDGYASAYVRSLDGDLQLQHSRQGTPRLVRHAASATAVDTTHDRAKTRLVPADAPFLHLAGITDAGGAIKPTATAKYRQVERFVEILDHTLTRAGAGRSDRGARAPLHAVDLGCGAGVLTMAAHHHLRHVAPGSTMVGVDTKTDLVERLQHTADRLRAEGGAAGLTFRAGTIAEFEPDPPPDLVLALHACDTATDDALAQALRWQSAMVLAAPCCQHHLQAQLDPARAPAGSAPLLGHGIVRERLGDLLTDTLRAEILRAHGYRTDVIEFVSTTHTAKNLMIRAVRTRDDPATRFAAAQSATALADTWGVRPALAERIGVGSLEWDRPVQPTAASIRSARPSTPSGPDQRSTTTPSS